MTDDLDFDNSNLTSDTNVELDKSKHKPSGNQVDLFVHGQTQGLTDRKKTDGQDD